MHVGVIVFHNPLKSKKLSRTKRSAKKVKQIMFILMQEFYPQAVPYLDEYLILFSLKMNYCFSFQSIVKCFQG